MSVDHVASEFMCGEPRDRCGVRLRQLASPVNIPISSTTTTSVSQPVMDHTVRVERIKTIPSYDKAFDHLTNFYKRRKISHDRPVDEVVDLTGEDVDSTTEPEELMNGEGGDDGETDEEGLIQRASGVQCRFIQIEMMAELNM